MINGTPATCGGEILSGQTLNCFKLDNKTKTWIQVITLEIFLILVGSVTLLLLVLLVAVTNVPGTRVMGQSGLVKDLFHVLLR